MSSYFHAVAVDYDGTLARGPRPTSEVLNAVATVRDNGRKVVLVTGRILSELRADFPDVDQHFDCIVGENGAVISSRYGTRLLGPPVDTALEYDLRTQGVPVRRGEVLLATNSIHDEFVTSAIDRLGFECQIVRNRAALMVLPAGVTKGSGLDEALGDLGISPHNTVAIGDAENDHSLLDVCEVGVAVGDAVPSLKARADLVLGGVDGESVGPFLVGPFLSGLTGLQSRRRPIALGTYDDGTTATLPASRISIAIDGASGTGKSYLAGLIAEQLIQMNYAICIIDLEGDHLAIGGLHGAVALGGREPLPPPAQVDRVIRQGFNSVVIDLSLQTPDVKRRYALALLEQLRLTRSAVGLPHWIIVDEAHVPIAGGLRHWWLDADESGICVITYRPDLLAPELEQYVDFVITARADHLATLRSRGDDGFGRPFAAAARLTAHVRHWHKYIEGQLPTERRFYFRDRHGLTGRSAGNLLEFRDEIRHASAETLRHHGSHGDFSRWLASVCPAPPIVNAALVTEADLAGATTATDVERLRDQLLRALDGKYSTPPSDARPDSGNGSARDTSARAAAW
jgi:hydroxymethylpyrimidine pyrophosphatase-like HAD family hydrolase